MVAPRNFKILRKSGNEVLALFFSLIFQFPPKVKAAIQDRKNILWSFKLFVISKFLDNVKLGLPCIFISFLNLSTLIPINLKNFTAKSNLLTPFYSFHPGL